MAESGWVRLDRAGEAKGPDSDEAVGIARIRAGGRWTIAESAVLQSALVDASTDASADASTDASAGARDRVRIDLSEVVTLDTAGAFIIVEAADRLRESGVEVAFDGVSDRHRPLLDLVTKTHAEPDPGYHKPATGFIRLLEELGEGTFNAMHKGVHLLNFVGLVTVTFMRSCLQPHRFRGKAIIHQIELTGLDALPIVGLLTFLVGIVLAYLTSDQLRQFAAEIFTVDLIGLSVLREIGVLITAIMVAGRSGSAFTAEIGTMQVNEEIDAMGTLGLDPIEVLVLPRTIALMITLPFLTFFADIMGVLGGGVMSVVALDISPTQFVARFKDAVGVEDFLVGLVKAPVHAYIIAIVGCYEGLKVKRTADSVGRQTTLAVVESIFLVIVATAGFSILFSALGI